jgi:hypothetical protein
LGVASLTNPVVLRPFGTAYQTPASTRRHRKGVISNAAEAAHGGFVRHRSRTPSAPKKRLRSIHALVNAARKAEIGSARLLERLRRYHREGHPRQEPTAAGYGTDQSGNGGSLAGAIGAP